MFDTVFFDRLWCDSSIGCMFSLLVIFKHASDMSFLSRHRLELYSLSLNAIPLFTSDLILGLLDGCHSADFALNTDLSEGLAKSRLNLRLASLICLEPCLASFLVFIFSSTNQSI